MQLYHDDPCPVTMADIAAAAQLFGDLRPDNYDSDDYAPDDDRDQWGDPGELTDAQLDEMAAEAAAADAVESGMLPPDIARKIASASLIGLADTDDREPVDAVAVYQYTAEKMTGHRMTRKAASQALACAWFGVRLGR